jgi:hypothetical protein
MDGWMARQTVRQMKWSGVECQAIKCPGRNWQGAGFIKIRSFNLVIPKLKQASESLKGLNKGEVSEPKPKLFICRSGMIPIILPISSEILLILLVLGTKLLNCSNPKD